MSTQSKTLRDLIASIVEGNTLNVAQSTATDLVAAVIDSSGSANALKVNIYGISGTTVSGATGAAGTSGTDGTSGSSGVNGTSGSSGKNGTSGSSGVNGTSGSSGINGTDGTSGSSGESFNGITSTLEITSSGTTALKVYDVYDGVGYYVQVSGGTIKIVAA